MAVRTLDDKIPRLDQPDLDAILGNGTISEVIGYA